MQPGKFHWRNAESANGGVRHRALFFEPFEGQVIWGATAAITVRLMDILRGERVS
jgi:hypothetical protein